MSAAPPLVLLIEDEPQMRRFLRTALESHDYRLIEAVTAREGLAQAAGRNPDVILLDLGLPGEDGFTLTRYLRERWKGALIIVTGRGDSIDRVVGLELGADDYVTKPFDLRELLARVRSVLRRSVEAPAAAPSPGANVVRFGGFRLDLDSRDLFDGHGNVVPLTSGEFELLSIFVAHPNRVLSRDDLMNRIHGREAGPYDRAIDVQIGRLRRKVEPDPAQPALIKSVRGAGYIFTAAVERR